jgi:hypothetical protein
MTPIRAIIVGPPRYYQNLDSDLPLRQVELVFRQGGNVVGGVP